MRRKIICRLSLLICNRTGCLISPTPRHNNKDAALIAVDNLSTICRSLKENEADSFGPVQDWMLRQRAAERSVLPVHHAGKAGTQRGTSRKEDALDTVIELRRPPGYDASQGARVHFSKSRGFIGDDAKSFEAWLKDDRWEKCDINTNSDDETIRARKVCSRNCR